MTLAANSSPVGGELQLIASDGENVPVVFFAADAGPSSSRIQLEPGKEVTVSSYLKAGPQKSRFSARLIEPATGKIFWQASLPSSLPAPLSSTTPLVITLGASVGVEDALRFTRRNEADALVAAEVKSATELPDQWWGYEGIETIFLPTGSAGILRQLTAPQRIAITQWVREGGRLVVSSGSEAKQLLADDSSWKELIPGQLVEVGPMRDAATLETLTGEAFPFTDDASRPPVARLTAVRGKVELAEGPRAANVPLVIRTPFGLGEVTFVAFDLDGERFAKWPGRPRFVSTLLRASRTQEQPGGQAGVRLGYTDLTGQLRGAMDQFPGVQVINFTTVALLIVAYIVLIGPVDYFLLQRLGVSRTLTWITFPLIALLFCGIAWYSANWSHGSRLRLNQAEIIDVDGQHVRGTAWLHLYSPATKNYDVELHPDFPTEIKTGATASYMTWQGLPGSGLGGLDAQQVSRNAADPYAIEYPSPAAGLRSLPIQVGSSKSLAARWWQEIPPPAASKLALNEHGVPTGDLVNPLDVELQDCIFTFNIWMYRLKKLGPGERFSLSDARPLYLESRLQQHKANDFKDSATPWIRDSADVPAILQMLMYHEAAQGQAYTGLTHRYQTHLDLSSQLTRGRGLLVGRAEKSAARVQIDGATLPAVQFQSWTFYRIVLPVASKTTVAP
ncbi:MAG: hypothetical protein K8R36_01460 [Planctomycetales bacterium]|nr:hypothetical protein [Planctomycetales bacterium]